MASVFKEGVALAASGLLLLALFALAGPDALAARLSGADPALFGLALVSIVCSLLCWSQGLRPLLAAVDGPVTTGRAAVAYTASMFGRQIIPVGAFGGPAITAYALDRETRLAYDETLAVVTVAEFLSTVASLVVAAAGLAYLTAAGSGDPGLSVVAGLLLVVAGALVTMSILVWYRRSSVSWIVGGAAWLLRWVGKRVSPSLVAWASAARTRRALGRFYETVDTLRGSGRAVLVSSLYHLIGWTLVALPLSVCALAIDLQVSFALACVLVPASLFVDVLPLPGGLGGVEVALAGLLVLLGGVDLAGATAVVVLYRLATFWFVIALGAATAIYGSLPVRDLLDSTAGRE